MANAIHAYLSAVMHQPFLVHSRANACLVNQINSDLLDDARANALKYILTSVPFDYDIIDAGFVQQLSKQQSRRTCANDHNLSPHDVSPMLSQFSRSARRMY
jgi:hypothetical protein